MCVSRLLTTQSKADFLEYVFSTTEGKHHARSHPPGRCRDKSIIKIIDPAIQVLLLQDATLDGSEDADDSLPAWFLDGVIEVEVVSIRAGAVRLRINAPRGVPVHRREIYDEIQAEIKHIQDEKRNTQ